VLKWQLGVSRLLDLDYERHPSFGAAEREWLACVLVRDGVHVLVIAIGTALDDATTKLGLLVGIVEIDEGERDPRITLGVLRFERAFPRADQDAVSFTAHPNGGALGRTIRHQGGEMGEVGSIEKGFDFVGK
jgi:hypothetical protein